MALFDALRFKVGMDAGPFKKGLKDIEGETKKSSGRMSASFAKVGAAAVAATVVGVGAALAKVGTDAVKTGAQFEALSTRLGTLMGSMSAGQQRMEELFEFASTTPFELAGITEAEVNLRALGVNAEEALPLILDFAGAMGTDVASAAVEVGRAMQFGAGAVETISGRALRAQIELRTGQDALSMSTEQFREELIKTLTDPQGIFAGGTAKLAATFDGMVSNLLDNVTKFQKAIADAGLFDAAKLTLREVLDLLGRNEQRTNQWAQSISGVLTEAIFAVFKAVGAIHDGIMGIRATWALFNAAVDQAIADFTRLFLVVEDVKLAAAEFLGLDTSMVQQARDDMAAIGMEAERSAEAQRENADAITKQIGLYADISGRITKIRGELSAMAKQQEEAPVLGATPAATPAAKGETGADKALQTLERLRDLTLNLQAAQLEGEEAIIFARDQQLAQIDEMASKFVENQEIQQQAELARIEATAKAEMELAELRQRLADEEQAAREAQAELEKQLAIERRQFMVENAMLLSDSLVKINEARREKERKGSIKLGRALFRIQQALAIVQIAMNTSAAVVKAFEMFGPPPSPIGIASAALAGAAGAAAATAVATQKPAFDVGGIVGTRGGVIARAPDQTTASVLPGEGVVNTGGMRDLGAGGLNEINRREGRQSRPQVVAVVGQRQAWRDEVRRAGPVRDEIRRNDPIGQTGF